MNPVTKGFFGLVIASALLAGSAIHYGRRHDRSSAFLLGGIICFVVVALTHVFEALAILTVAGWGQPGSVGHYIDLVAAVLGLSLVFAALLLRFAARRTT